MEKGLTELLAAHQAAMLETARLDVLRLETRRDLKAALQQHKEAVWALREMKEREAKLRGEIADHFVPYAESEPFDAELRRDAEAA
jgi:hypothetical protein